MENTHNVCFVLQPYSIRILIIGVQPGVILSLFWELVPVCTVPHGLGIFMALIGKLLSY